MSLLRRAADGRDENSLATRLRRNRFALFRDLLSTVPRPLTILDVGGEQVYWERMGLADSPDIRFVILNVSEERVTLPNFTAVAGDACDMREYVDGRFDVVFSNSVIEHVGDAARQERMAREIRRVGKAFFVQTPYRYFPIEPHFVFPFFQFLSPELKAFLIRHLNITYTRKRWTPAEAATIANEISLLTERQLRGMFPGADLHREKVLGLTKSLTVYGGFP